LGSYTLVVAPMGVTPHSQRKCQERKRFTKCTREICIFYI